MSAERELDIVLFGATSFDRFDALATENGAYRALGASDVMFGESSLCLALDSERLPPRAGVLTPATAMGDALVERLRRARQTFAVEREG
jgi:short subunit dehydrogenase-like uncharacterized protein